MHLNVSKPGDRVVVAVPGPRLGTAEVPDFKRALAAVIEETQEDIVLDLADVDFVDSSGIGAIVSCLRQVKSPRRMSLMDLKEPVARVFSLTRMDRVFRIEDSLTG